MPPFRFLAFIHEPQRGQNCIAGDVAGLVVDKSPWTLTNSGGMQQSTTSILSTVGCTSHSHSAVKMTDLCTFGTLQSLTQYSFLDNCQRSDLLKKNQRQQTTQYKLLKWLFILEKMLYGMMSHGMTFHFAGWNKKVSSSLFQGLAVTPPLSSSNWQSIWKLATYLCYVANNFTCSWPTI